MCVFEPIRYSIFVLINKSIASKFQVNEVYVGDLEFQKKKERGLRCVHK